jgi:hypothetical protein
MFNVQKYKNYIDKTIIRPAGVYRCETDTECSISKDNVQCQDPGLCCLIRNFVNWRYQDHQIEEEAEFFSGKGGSSTNSVEDRGQRERGFGAVAP